MDVLPYESLADLHDSEPPLISRIAVGTTAFHLPLVDQWVNALIVVCLQISNCLRVSSLFENVCAIGILRVLSHHFVPLRFLPGATFVVENIPGERLEGSRREECVHDQADNYASVFISDGDVHRCVWAGAAA
jgi:hypothetical protein